MKAKSKTETRPIYSAQIEGAAGNINSAYSAQAPKIGAITDQLGSLVPGLLDRYTSGDPNITAARDYDKAVLGREFLGSNPHLDDIVQRSNDGVRNGVAASLGTRGLTGGSAFSDIISRNLAANDTNLRYQDYSAERARMDAAANRAGTYGAAEQTPIASILNILGAQQMPLQTAVGAGNGVGGLLGQYTNQSTTSTPSIAMLMAQMAGNAASAYAGGGFK